jgi:hypothetical protein
MGYRGCSIGQESFYLRPYCIGKTGFLSTALPLQLSCEIGHELMLLCEI